MSNYYGVINRIDSALYCHILYGAEVCYILSIDVLIDNTKIFLDLLKSKLKFCKKHGIYYFKRFNAEMTNHSEPSAKIKDVSIASLINLRNNTNHLIFFP